MAIGISYTNETLAKKAHATAHDLSLPLTDNYNDERYSLLVVLYPRYIALCEPSAKRSQPFYINFLSEKIGRRLDKASVSNELLFKAVGASIKQPPTIIDATAGFGEDAFLLANQGCDVTMVERSPIIALLLHDALARLQQQSTRFHLRLHQRESVDYLRELKSDALPDVIYLDPMYPESRKTALNKKSMRLLRQIAGDDKDIDTLFNMALTKAKKRVVVKRPRLAPCLTNTSPTTVYKGKAVRFDVYIQS